MILCILIAYPQWCQSQVPFYNVKFELFDKRTTNFEHTIYNSLQSTQNFFARDDVKKAIEIETTIVQFIPFVSEINSIIHTVIGLLDEESDWKKDFSKAIASETMRLVADNQIHWMQSQIKTIRKNIHLLDENKQPNLQSRMANAQFIHNSLDTMVNYLGNKVSVFRKFPLVTSPLVISLSLLIATFIPIAKSIIPIETEELQLACKTQDLLEKYRSRAVMARADKVNTIYDHYDAMMKELSKPYNSRGYNQLAHNTLHCSMGCHTPDSHKNSHCIVDEFSKMKYNYGNTKCINEYTALIRHRMEEMFPVEIFTKLCGNGNRERRTTGKIHNSYKFVKSVKIAFDLLNFFLSF